jgi:hypothetical protein
MDLVEAAGVGARMRAEGLPQGGAPLARSLGGRRFDIS